MHRATTAQDLNSAKHAFFVVFFVVGVIFTCLGWPLAKRRVKPNGTYGFRTPKTLSNPSLWYATNETTGKGFVIAGIAIALTSLALFPLPFLVYSTGCVAILLGSTFGVTFVAWYKHLR